MILSLYVARRFARMFLLVAAIFFAILFMVETIEQVRRLAGTGNGLREAATLALLNVPGSIYRILPLITILATVALFLTLARTSELVVIRAAGRSALRALVAPLVTAILIGVLAVSTLNPIVASTTKRSEDLSARYERGQVNVLSVGREGLWLRQGGESGQVVIHARKSNADGTVLQNVTFLTLEGGSQPTARLEASEARLEPGRWILSKVKEWDFGPDANPEGRSRRVAAMDVPSDLTADKIKDSFADPAVIPFWDLPSFIGNLRSAGFSATRHELWFQTELALPLLLAAMVLGGAGLTMRHARFGRAGLMALLSVIFGFAVFFLRNFAQILGENGHIPVLLAAWSPPVAAILMSVALLLHLEDG